MKTPLIIKPARLLAIGAAALAVQFIIPSSHGQIDVSNYTIRLGDYGTDSANSATAPARTGETIAPGEWAADWNFRIGNPNSASPGNHDFQILLKWDISELQDTPNILDATVTFTLGRTVSGNNDLGMSMDGLDFHTINVRMITPTGTPTDPYLSSDPFARRHVDTTPSTAVGSFNVESDDTWGTTYTLSIGAALQTAVNNNYEFFAIRLDNAAATVGGSYPRFITLNAGRTNSNLAPYLTVQAIPEPTTGALLGLVGLAALCARRRSRL